MAPRKRKTEKEPSKVLVTEVTQTTTTTRRVTRSFTRGGSSANAVESKKPEVPARKKAKGAKQKVQVKKEKEESEKGEDDGEVAVKEKETTGESEEKAEEAGEEAEEAEDKEEKEEVDGEEEEKATENAGEESENKKTIVIEHCKQCNSFKTRANQVKDGLEEGVSGIKVLLNPDKPRRGCFEIREEGGETFISLLDMKRPFKPMKDLNMEEVIDNIIEKIK